MTAAVGDASVLVAALLDSGNDGRWAERQLEAFDLAAPHLVLVEASDVLRRAALASDVGDGEAALAQAELVRLDLALFAFEPFADRVWQLRSNLTAYDAWYVALAEALDCPLLTLDERIARAPGIACAVRTPGV